MKATWKAIRRIGMAPQAGKSDIRNVNHQLRKGPILRLGNQAQ